MEFSQNAQIISMNKIYQNGYILKNQLPHPA